MSKLRIVTESSKPIASPKKKAAKTWLWGLMNTTICAWLYRRVVVTQYSPKSTRMTRDIFTKCLMSLAADERYSDWLLGRGQSFDRDRSPCYRHAKLIIGARYAEETGKKAVFPAPAWVTG